MRSLSAVGTLRLSFAVATLALGVPSGARAQLSAPAPPAAAAKADRLAALLAPAGGLTADEAARRAADTSVEGKVRRQTTAAAAEKVEQARDGWLPRVTGTARYTRLSPLAPVTLGGANLVVTTFPATTPPTPLPAGAPLIPVAFTFPVILDNYLLQASLAVPISDYVLRVGQSIAAAERSERAALLNERAARLQAAAQARLGFYQWIRARGAVAVTEQVLEQSRGHKEDAERLFQAGIASKADVMRAESAAKSVELALVRGQNQAQLAEEQLRVAMHDPGGTPYGIGEDVRQPLPPAGLPPAPDLLAEATARRLEVKALEEGLGALGELERLARAGQFPRLDLVGNAIYANPNQRIFPLEDKFKGTWDASLVLSWSPNDLLVGRASERESRARVAELGAQKEALLDGLRLEITQARQAVLEAEAALETTAKGLAAAEEAYRVRNELFRMGKATLVELTDTETDVFRARLEALSAHIDARVARVKLTHATGRDVD